MKRGSAGFPKLPFLLLLKDYFFFSLTNLMIPLEATAPSETALATWRNPPVQSPAAKTPSTVVIKAGSTMMFPPPTRAPILLAKSTADAVPMATKIPSTG